MPTKQVAQITGLKPRTINDIFARAIERGFDPKAHPLAIKDEYLTNAPKSGRPKKQTIEAKEAVLSKVRGDRHGRELTCNDIAGFLGESLGMELSGSTVYRILKTAGFKKTKPTRKPGLTAKMRAERLQWCLDHQDWTLEDFKNVIWTDETAVVLGQRRGGLRIWRLPDEAFLKSCIRERWKGFSEFMFWGSFTYDQKGPFHCYLPETPQEKKAAQKAIDELNQELEPAARINWELERGMARLGLRGIGGPKPTWTFTSKQGKLERGSKGGIDWWRYRHCVLLPKLFPFAKKCMEERPNTIVMEDKAPAHVHYIQQLLYDKEKIKRLQWPGNSPDINAIEPGWMWMKRNTTKKGAPKNRAEAIQVWGKWWKDLPQTTIQRWIERIPEHIKEIIRLEGGNEYHEGKKHIERPH